MTLPHCSAVVGQRRSPVLTVSTTGKGCSISKISTGSVIQISVIFETPLRYSATVPVSSTKSPSNKTGNADESESYDMIALQGPPFTSAKMNLTPEPA